MSKRGKGSNQRPKTVFIQSLGCAKNTVDAQGMATLLEREGYRLVYNPKKAGLIIVNTCGFIDPARQESLMVLQEQASRKRPGQLLIAAGCWSQRSPQVILEAVPQLDGLIGTRRWMDVVGLIQQLGQPGRSEPVLHLPETPCVGQDEQSVPRVAIQGGSAYLKIADGCSRSCAFCAIPLIKGPALSRPAERILEEAVLLEENGAREIILIAQDTTAYGRDLGKKDGLAELLEQMVKTVRVPWIRVMYAFPGAVTSRLIDIMAQAPQVLPYLDIPLQHGHPDVLRRMRRPADVNWIRQTVDALRTRMPQIAIRTTFVVGYPGETEQEFAALMDLVQEMTFDRVGVFVYSHEEGTEAADFPDDVPPNIKEERRARLMEIQQPISLAKNQSLVGQVLDVLIEGQGEGLIVGRTYRDAPEIDGLVLVENAATPPVDIPVGEIVPVQITGALEYDLIGQLQQRNDASCEGP